VALGQEEVPRESITEEEKQMGMRLRRRDGSCVATGMRGNEQLIDSPRGGYGRGHGHGHGRRGGNR